MSDLTQHSMSLQRKTMEGEEPNSRENFFDRLPNEVFVEIIENVANTSRNQLVDCCLVSHDFRKVAQPVLYRRLRINPPKPMSTPAENAWVWTKHLACMAEAIVGHPDLTGCVKYISFKVSKQPAAGCDWPLLGELDDEPFVPLLLKLQSVAEKGSGRSFRPVAPGDNIVDVFMEALFSLCSKRIYANLKAYDLGVFPRISQFIHNPDMPVCIMCFLAPSTYQQYAEPDDPCWQYSSEIREGVVENKPNDGVVGRVELEVYHPDEPLGEFRHLIQNAAARGLWSLKLTGGGQMKPLDFGDIIPTFEPSHNSIEHLGLFVEHSDESDPANPPRPATRPFSLKALRKLSGLDLSYSIFRAVAAGGSFARVLPESLNELELLDICDDEGLDHLKMMMEDENRPNLKVLCINFRGDAGKLRAFRRQMESAEVEFIF